MIYSLNQDQAYGRKDVNVADETQKQQESAEPDLLEKTSGADTPTEPKEPARQSKKGSPWLAGISLIALSVSLGHLSYSFWGGAISPLLTQAGISIPLSADQASANQAEITALQSQLAQLQQDLADYQQAETAPPDLTALLNPAIEKERGQIEKQVQQEIDKIQAQFRQSQASGQKRQTDISQELDLMADRLLRMTREMETAQQNLKQQQQTILTQAEQGQQGLRAQKTLVAELQLQQNRFGQELGRFQQQLAEMDGQKWVTQAMRLTLAAKLAQGGRYDGFKDFIKSETNGLMPEDRQFLLDHLAAQGVTALDIQLTYLTMRPQFYQAVTQMPEIIAAQSRGKADEGQNWASQTWERAKSLIRIEKINTDPTGQNSSLAEPQMASQLIRQDIDLLSALDQAVQNLDYMQIQEMSRQMKERHSSLASIIDPWLAEMHILKQMTQISDRLIQGNEASSDVMKQGKGQLLPEGSGQ